MKRGALALGAAVVVAALVALYVVIRTDDPRDTHVASLPKITQADPGKAGKVARPVPSAAASGEQTVRRSSPVTDYMVGGVRVRDHRSGERTLSDVPPAIHPPEGRKIPSQLTSDVAQRIRAVMTECAMNLPSEVRGSDPRLEGTIAIAIKDRRATVTSASVQLRDVTGAAADPVKRCIEQNSVGIVTAAGDAPDVSGYAIALAFRLP